MASSPEHTPTKKRCVLTNGKRPMEYVREFELQQQFPSTLKQALERGIKIGGPVASSITRPGNARVSSNVKNRIPYNFQRLRILSPRGKDLGEFSVKLKSPNPLKGSTITITKSDFSPPTPCSHTRTVPRILKQDSRKVLRNKLVEAISCRRSISWTDKGSEPHRQKFRVLPMNRPMLSNGVEDTEVETDKQTCNGSGINRAPSTIGLNSKQSVCQTVDNSNQKYVSYHGTGDTDIRNCTKVQGAAAENSEVSSVTETPLRKEIVESFLESCKTAMKDSSDKSTVPFSGKSLKISKGKCIATIKNTENGKIVTSLKSAAGFMQKYNESERNLNHNGLHNTSNNSRKSLNSEEVSYDNSNSLQTKSNVVPKSQAPESKAQNVMTIIPGNETHSFNQNAILAQVSNAPVASVSIKNVANITDHDTARHDTRCDNTLQAGSRNESRLVAVDDHVRHILESQRITDVANVENRNLSRRNMSDQLNIIRKAMDNVEDSELRELALKALADCGIGIERYIPICPPEDHKAVHDTQTQTIVFGLLDPKSFILINKDLEDIHRLSQIILHDISDKENPLADNSHSDNNFACEDPNVNERESPFDLDSFMDQFWKENSDALKMKETLSMTRTRCNSLLDHLQRDFECVKRYDQNGMLNIHNAVVNDNVNLVRRQLMVLDNCKQSVDILTEDGVTSLELAIKYGVSSEIVKLLLDAGAQPVIPRSVHESAMIIASKNSSPLLPMLVNRVSDLKLLDQIDSNGLAAIHYCSIHGNLQGVKALVSAGATIDLKDMKSGRTSLFHAIDNSHTSVMQVLLKAGAVANIANYAGQTALAVIADPKNMSFRMSLKKDT